MALAIQGVIRRLCQQQNLVRYMCNYPKNTSVYEPRKADHDFLFTNLKNANNTRNVLDMVAMHGGIMNNKHMMQALRSLFTLQKQGNTSLSTKEILGNKDFKKLCRQLRYQAGTIELNDTLEALKVVSYVGVSSDTTIIQVLLQLLRHNINSLTLQQIMFLDFLLCQFTPSPLVDALKIALPIVFEINMPVKMDTANVAHLADYLFFLSRNPIRQDLVEKLVVALMRFENFDTKTSKSIVWSICDMDSNDMFKPLMQKAINSLMVHADELSYNDLESTLSKMIIRYNRKSSYFYDETFYDTCANVVIDKDLGYKHSIYLLRKFARVNHFHKHLLDYMSQKIRENPDCVTKADPLDIYGIVTATSMTDYRPIYWEVVKKFINQCDNLAQIDRKEISWIKFGASLCLLDFFKLDVLPKCLNEAYLENLFRRRFRCDFENYATIWTCIKLFKPELNCLLAEKYAPENLVQNFKQNITFPLEAALYKALGGDKYVKTDLNSKCGQQIDHIVVFRKGGYPVALNFPHKVEFIEDIELQADHQLIVILGLRPFNYTLNHRRVKYNISLNIKVLESKGFPVVPICLEIWENLPDFEKIPYLMQAIKDRTNSDLNVSESVI